MMTDNELAEIGARAKAATRGPWQNSPRSCDWNPGDDERGGLGFDIEGPPEPQLRGQFSRWADAEFIAHARDDVPALVAEVRRLVVELRDRAALGL